MIGVLKKLKMARHFMEVSAVKTECMGHRDCDNMRDLNLLPPPIPSMPPLVSFIIPVVKRTYPVYQRHLSRASGTQSKKSAILGLETTSENS